MSTVSIHRPGNASDNSVSELSAEEFFQKYSNQRVELVCGQVQELPMPDFLHGYICAQVAWYIQEYVKKQDLGRVMSNDTFIKVRQNPDSLFGADVCFISYDRLPKGIIPTGLLDVIPELVVEVHSPSNVWTAMIAKVLDYLAAGVKVVVVLNPSRQAIAVYRSDMDEQQFSIEQELTLPDLFPGLAVPVRQFFS